MSLMLINATQDTASARISTSTKVRTVSTRARHLHSTHCASAALTQTSPDIVGNWTPLGLAHPIIFTDAENQFGMRIESVVAVQPAKEKGWLRYERITKVPIDKRLVDFSILTQFEKEWLHVGVLRMCIALTTPKGPQRGRQSDATAAARRVRGADQTMAESAVKSYVLQCIQLHE